MIQLMNSSISMLLHVSKLCKCIIFLAHAQLTVNNIKNDKFAKLYEITFYREMSAIHAEHISYIIVMYTHIYIYKFKHQLLKSLYHKNSKCMHSAYSNILASLFNTQINEQLQINQQLQIKQNDQIISKTREADKQHK